MSTGLLNVRAAACDSRSSRRKAKVMEFPSMQGDSLTRLLLGAPAGAAITMIVGFNWGGWALGAPLTRSRRTAPTRRSLLR
jgi:hypothetical protein